MPSNQNAKGRGAVQTGKRPAKQRYTACNMRWPEDDPTGAYCEAWLAREGKRLGLCRALTVREFWTYYMALSDRYRSIMLDAGKRALNN